MAHRLDSLLRPASVAVVGASDGNDSMGEWALRNLLKGGYKGDIYPVNPKYDEVQGVPCFASFGDLPETPELVIFAVGDHRLEAALDEAIAAGSKAAVIMSTLYLDDDVTPPLKERVQQKAQRAGMLVCGANGMGFYNVRDHVWACGFDSSDHAAPGNVALISHSGAGMSGLIDSEERLRINLAVSSGNEIGVTMDEYLDFALDLPETKAVGLFIETARNPSGFRAALEKAAQRKIPVVAIKVGRTEQAAQLAVSHSGAMVGDDAAYDALFDCYGVQRVRDMDELATALILFAELGVPGSGGLVTLHDSGGERQLLADLADEAGVPLTDLDAATTAALEEVLDPELPAVNPLDGWSRGGPDADEKMTRSLSLMMRDPGTAMGAVIHDRAPYGKIYPSYLRYMKTAAEESGKPVALVSARQGSGHDEVAVSSSAAGLPVLDGVSSFLTGVRAMFAYRDFLACDKGSLPAVTAPEAIEVSPGEAAALKLLGDFKLPVVRCSEASDEAAAVAAALGPEVIVAAMAGPGIEMMLGAKRDPQFGPIVLIGFGGLHAETLNDVAFALPPFGAAHARRCIDRLKLRPLLDGTRGKAAADIDAFCNLAAKFSAVAHALRDDVAEIDLNPVIVHESSCTIVDALVIP